MNTEQAATNTPLTRFRRVPATALLNAWSPQVFWVTVLTLLLIFGHLLPAAKFFATPANYLPLHTLLEFISMAVSAMVFALAWNLRRQSGNSHRMILGAGFLAVSMIDFAHTLSFAGMPDLITPSDPEKAINFWLAGRYTAAAVLLGVAIFPLKQWSIRRCKAAILIAFVFVGIVWWMGLNSVGWLPRTFIHGQGLTAIKIGAEYLLALLYGVAAILLYRQSRRIDNEDLRWLAAASWVLGLAEMFFTLYQDVTDTFNLLGHLYKVIAYIMVYLALFAAGVLAPYRELDLEHARLQTLLATIPDLIWLKNEQGIYISCNKAFERFFGARECEVIGKTDYDFVSHELADSFRKNDKAAMAANRPSVNEEWLSFAADNYRGLFETTKSAMYTPDGKLIGVLGIAHDVTARKNAEDEIRNLAFFDPLTHLPNRRLLLDRLQHALTASLRSENNGALLYIDMDNFKPLNDTLGHDVGDLLLQTVAERLTSCVRDVDTVARLGGDEFLIMLDNLNSKIDDAAKQSELIAEKVLLLLSQTYHLDGHEHHSTASIGIALFTDYQGQSGIEELLKRADLAMYQAKAAGRNTLRFYNPEMQAAVTARAALETDLHEAIRSHQFVLHYQPQMDSLGAVTGCEALLRWQHPQRGLVPPLAFIPLAEESGMIVPIGRWVLETACQQLVTWATRPETSHLSISINVSAHQFRQVHFVDEVLATLQRSGADPHRLKLELTESLLLTDVEDVIAKMNQLKKHQLGFSLDDFGTGYSSLSYVKRLPLDELKIDKSFVNDVLNNPSDAAIIRIIIAFAQSLGLDVIAEGVETQAQRDFLEQTGCHHYQGYFFSRALSSQDFDKFIEHTLKVYKENQSVTN
ncbi:bifunctional diguanylate cyclase/phosphodiesterase [Undibacterium sp. Ren11W]|uniref:bifunctional diguanylate cyclase/phosphodiesterase n=1 Tax=Undibacterium sp. Ren11W TaxID=3413045 RepID=UPI003BF082C9